MMKKIILAENQYFKVRPTDQESKEGDDVEFQCHIGNRGGDVQWSKDGFLLVHALDWALGKASRLRITDATLVKRSESQCLVRVSLIAV
ncbi:hypothetical protein TNCT_116371 [Trichonephila clavata]|uniref:Nephrin n=1 Tax=Trichonephila clavata TaxID=2740835 RepID=A0A8X6K7T5_TRICU|nr:hypothetical protein TNCT_116371 [Trichonephila clavata]